MDRVLAILLVSSMTACIDDGRPLSEWESEYEQAVERERMFADMNSSEDMNFETVCSVDGGAPRQMSVEVLLDEAVIVYKVDNDCALIERGRFESMTVGGISTHVGHVWQFALESSPDEIFQQHVVGDSNNLVLQ